ncbi:hypothetical protein MKW92_037799 [Papaver armeniacum]|nr:hypothetical protein MKW92_037799 [Papaver armeniacum]
MKMMSVPEAHHSLLCFQLTGKSRKCGPMILHLKKIKHELDTPPPPPMIAIPSLVY